MLVKDVTGCGSKKFSKFSYERMRPEIFNANAKAGKQPDVVLLVLSKKKESVHEHRLLFLKREKSVESKKPTLLTWAFCNPGTGLFFQAVSRQVLSLLTVFTFVFGMGTGVFRSQWHQVC